MEVLAAVVVAAVVAVAQDHLVLVADTLSAVLNFVLTSDWVVAVDKKVLLVQSSRILHVAWHIVDVVEEAHLQFVAVVVAAVVDAVVAS